LYHNINYLHHLMRFRTNYHNHNNNNQQ